MNRKLIIPIALLLALAGCGESPAPQPPQADGREPPAAAAAFDIEAAKLDEQLLAEGWISLFDGQTLFGWKNAGNANFLVEDGAIVVDEGEICLLCTTSRFSDYELHVEFKADADTNSGIFLRTPPTPENPVTDCYELNIAPESNPFPTGSLVGRHKTEGKAAGQGWRTYDVTMDGSHVTVKLDGEAIVDYDSSKESAEGEPHVAVARGLIGLQHNSGRVAFRNIRLKPLNVKPLLNAELSEWTQDGAGESEFSIQNGELMVKNGPGQLETNESFADFVLQLEYQTHAANLNSGIFFRCIPGDTMMGYESQIHNGFKNGDRTQPIDCGTGGIFRRQDARLVVGDDERWVYKTLVVDGTHMAAWVDGIQVSDWTDERGADENPRKGLRTKAGTIMIQGHDPTTNLSFRNMGIAAQ